MTQSIETYLKNLLLTTLLVSTSSFAMGQIYQSPQHCVVDYSPGTPSTGGGGTGGGGETPDMSCIRPSFFFDTDTSSSNWVWDIVNPSNPLDAGSYTDVRSINHNFISEGVYTVSLTKTTNSNTNPSTVTESFNVNVGTYPQRPMFNDKPKADTTVCGGNTLKLNPYKGTLPIGNYSYLWYPTGDTSRTIDVDSSGCYSVEVTNENTGCSRTASITVKFCLQQAASGGGAEKWYFGNGATIEFLTDFGPPIEEDSLASEGDVFGTPETDPNDVTVSPIDNAGSNPLNSNTATAMVYGPSGGLAYYTDGINIYNGNDELITDGNGNSIINADPDASQGIVIVPKSNCNECPHHEYYVIYIDKDTKILTRATIDLRYNGGQGIITETNVPIAYPVTEKVSAVKNGDETGYILISQEQDTNIFTFTTIDSSGTSTISQSIGVPKENNASYSGYISTNLEGNKIAVGYTDANGENYIEVYDLDKGNPSSTPPSPPSLSNRIEIPLGYTGPPNVYGIEFSENGDFLYVTLRGDPTNGESSFLLQLPLIAGVTGAEIAAAINIIDQSVTEAFGALKLGPVNGPGRKFIYMAIDGETEVPFIQQPDIRGGPADIGYTRVTSSIKPGVEVSGTSQAGLPNVVFANQQQDGEGISATYNGNCFNSATELEVQDVCSPLRNEVIWSFEDGTQIKGSPAAYTFPKLGWNKITLTIKIYNTSPLKKLASNQILNKAIELTETVCSDSVIVDSIYIKPSPISNLSDITYLCFKDLNAGIIPQDSIFLVANATGGDTLFYDWTTSIGSTIQRGLGIDTLFIAAPSLYKLEITNEFDCLTKDETDARDGCEPKILLPTAITPNGDGLNESLKIIYAHIDDYNLRIFNRWGELVHDSSNPENQWDGKVKGRTQSPTVYPYVITYRSKDFPERGILRQKGTVWVLQ
ncbi:gliding motility-associated C-terminal domain-containing protein [Spirosomataceae bacterium TFI 002]|nr:gliding motility-associated C-terminal domain-containing protein [Spirosomataceae bacterium TFI 002]